MNFQRIQKFFIEAAAAILKDQDVYFVSAGGQITDENIVLSDRLKELGIKERFRLLGLRKDIPKLLSAMDILAVSSSFGEALPMILLEALANGALCVATDVGDSGLLLDGVGEVVPPNDPNALAAGFRAILDLSEPELRIRRELGKAVVAKEYSHDAMMRRYLALYQTFVE